MGLLLAERSLDHWLPPPPAAEATSAPNSSPAPIISPRAARSRTPPRVRTLPRRPSGLMPRSRSPDQVPRGPSIRPPGPTSSLRRGSTTAAQHFALPAQAPGGMPGVARQCRFAPVRRHWCDRQAQKLLALCTLKSSLLMRRPLARLPRVAPKRHLCHLMRCTLGRRNAIRAQPARPSLAARVKVNSSKHRP